MANIELRNESNFDVDILDKISLLDVDPTKEGVWARNTALVFNEDDTKAYIHKPYLDALTKDVDPKEK